MRYKIYAADDAAIIELAEHNTEGEACLKALQLSSLCPEAKIEVRKVVPSKQFSNQLQLVATYRKSVRL
jgi:hypothetical protein